MALHELKQRLKKGTLRVMARFGLDRVFRHLNRDKLLVVMYHGVTSKCYYPPIWTQLPVEIFRSQLEFLRDHYRVVTLPEVIAAVEGKGILPERAALITFDDGIKNNFSVAFPVLQELGLPAGIFLTVDLVGSTELFWFDELYLLVQEGCRLGVPLDLMGKGANEHYQRGEIWNAYTSCVESVKRAGSVTRDTLLERLRREVPIEREPWLEDFGLLNWDDVAVMEGSGLVSFGVHTATHRILSELEDHELVAEVLNPRQKMSSKTVGDAASFCFPNGRPGVDFHPRHQDFLRECGYRCAFTTKNELFDWRGGEPMGIGRVPAGNDCTSDPCYFSLSTSGAVRFFRRFTGA